MRIGDRVVNHVPSRDRDIAMVFQSYALYPHLTVYDNIAFGLRLKKLPKGEIDERVQKAARTLGLEDLLKRKPRNLSGGQRQRVAMGRAIVREPAAFLMDEPLSNLDAKLRVQMRAEISRLQRDLGVTTVYVTHDQVEAMTMGDRVAVMRKGELQQVDEPQNLYDRPLNLFVGGFIGSPAMNMVEATIERENGSVAVDLGTPEARRSTPPVLTARPAVSSYEGRNVILGIRPEHLEDASLAPDTPADRRLRGRVELREALGSELMVHFTVEGARRADDGGDEGARRRRRAPAPMVAQSSDVLFVGRFGARAQSPRASRSRCRSTRTLCISSTRRRVSASTTMCRRKEQHRDKSLGSEGRRLSWWSYPLAALAASSGGSGATSSTHAVSGSISFDGDLDRCGGRRVRGRDQGLQQGVPGREGHLQAGRRQPPDRALHCRRGRQAAGHGGHRAAGPRQAVRRQGSAEADRLRAEDAARELRAVVGRTRDVQQEDLRPRLQGG